MSIAFYLKQSAEAREAAKRYVLLGYTWHEAFWQALKERAV